MCKQKVKEWKKEEEEELRVSSHTGLRRVPPASPLSTTKSPRGVSPHPGSPCRIPLLPGHSSVHWFPGSSKEESSQALLSCSSGAMSSRPLPRVEVLVQLLLALLVCFWIPLPLLYSGMNTATRKDTRTIHAPNKNGGPGMTAPWHKWRWRIWLVFSNQN